MLLQVFTDYAVLSNEKERACHSTRDTQSAHARESKSITRSATPKGIDRPSH